jgi:hypothetical protein
MEENLFSNKLSVVMLVDACHGPSIRLGACGSWETIDDVAQSYVEISGFAYIVLQYGVWSLEYSEDITIL